jgi:hypothetical protein
VRDGVEVDLAVWPMWHCWVMCTEGRDMHGNVGKPLKEAVLGAASVVSFLAAVLAEIYLCNVCSCQEVLRRNGRG